MRAHSSTRCLALLFFSGSILLLVHELFDQVPHVCTDIEERLHDDDGILVLHVAIVVDEAALRKTLL